MRVAPESMWPAVTAMLHRVYDQPDGAAVAPGSPGCCTTSSTSFPQPSSTLMPPELTFRRSPTFPGSFGSRSDHTIPTNGCTVRFAVAPIRCSSSPAVRAGFRMRAIPNTDTEVNADTIMAFSAYNEGSAATAIADTQPLIVGSSDESAASAARTETKRSRKTRSSRRVRRIQLVTSTLLLLALHEPQAGTMLSSVYRPPRAMGCTQSRCSGRSVAPQ